MRRLDQRLREDPQLREELAEVERMLGAVDQSLAPENVIDVPHELVSRTLASIPHRQGEAAGLRSCGSSSGSSVAIRPSQEPPPRGRRSWADLLVLSLAAAAIFALMFPAVVRIRGEARKVACQDNLRQLGMAIGQFVLREREAHLPGLAESGPEAFAGMYAVRLADSGLLSDPRLRWCPETEIPATEPSKPNWLLADFRDPGGEPAAKTLTHLVIGDELQQAADAGDVSLLRWLQRVAGGHYAYSLGVVDGNRYNAPQYEGRSSFAVLGDAPIAGHHATDAVDVVKMRWSHGGEGANLLYEDGSVRHLRVPAMLGLPDHPFVNHRGSIEAGVNIDDASLAPSWRPPFIQARQR